MARKRHRVLLDCTSAAKGKRGGIQNYIVNLVGALQGCATDLEFAVGLRISHYKQRRHLLDLAPGGARLLVPCLWRSGDLLHGLGVRLPGLQPRLRKVVTVHDLGVFDAPDLYKPAWVTNRRRRIEQTLARAHGAIVYTQYTKDRIRHHLPRFSGRIQVTHLGVDHRRFRAEPDAEDHAAVARLGIDKPFVLQVGALAPRKAPTVTLRAFALLKAHDAFKLVLPGRVTEEFLGNLKDRARELGILDALICPGFVPDEALPQLYRQCSAFVFASQYEGFGLPVVEAMACGAPVIAAHTSCLPEVAGDGARFFTGADPARLAEALEHILAGGDAIAELRERAVARSREFTWQRTAERTIAFYREFL